MIVSMWPAGEWTLEYVLLWMYVVCFVLIWVYLPIAERGEEPPVLHWSSIVVHVAASAAMVVYLTGAVVVGGSLTWRVLLGIVVGIITIEDVMAYRRLMRKPEPRASMNQNRLAALGGAVGEAVLRLPCVVVIYRLADRA
jgi:hypothetical protein